MKKLVVLFGGGFAREDEHGKMKYCDGSPGPGWTKEEIEKSNYLKSHADREKLVLSVNDGGAHVI